MKEQYNTLIQLLEEELVPAVGCTEPSAIALAAAKAAELLGGRPERTVLTVSGNIVKNARSVTVPNTGGMVGIRAAAAAGIIAGHPELELEILKDVSGPQRREIRRFLETGEMEVRLSDSGRVFEISAEVFRGDDTARAVILDAHTNFVLLEKNGRILYEKDSAGAAVSRQADTDMTMTVAGIYDFIEHVELSRIEALVRRQIRYNTFISEAGLENDCGANIGRTLLNRYGGSDVRVRARAKAAAGSDARMSGSVLPVVTVCGSGNQGITASVPVVEYARETGATEEQTIRAVAFADLIAIYLKEGIGKLSAFCGALCAGIGAACGISYLTGGGVEEAACTISNASGILSGMVCDGAKASCAAKIAAAVDSGIFALEMYREGNRFLPGEGIISADVEQTVKNVARLGRVGLRAADREILQMMLQSENTKGGAAYVLS